MIIFQLFSIVLISILILLILLLFLLLYRRPSQWSVHRQRANLIINIININNIIKNSDSNNNNNNNNTAITISQAKPSERALPKSEPRKKELVERSGSPPPAKKAAAAKKEAPKGKVSAAGKMTSFFAKRWFPPSLEIKKTHRATLPPQVRDSPFLRTIKSTNAWPWDGIRVLCNLGPLIRVFLNAWVRWRPGSEDGHTSRYLHTGQPP